MADPDPRRSPLDGLVPWQSPGGAIALDEMRFTRQIAVRTRSRATPYLGGVPLPLEPNRVEAWGPVRSLWLGPDEILVTAPDGAVPELLPRLVRAAPAENAAIVDLSSSRIAVLVGGGKSRALLEAGCAIDLHPRAFAPGRCAQSLLAGVPVILEQLSAAPDYRLFVRRSTARWLFDWLVDATAAVEP